MVQRSLKMNKSTLHLTLASIPQIKKEITIEVIEPFYKTVDGKLHTFYGFVEHCGEEVTPYLFNEETEIH
jgi:hypothetical protein